jgi:hypothetical protein
MLIGCQIDHGQLGMIGQHARDRKETHGEFKATENGKPRRGISLLCVTACVHDECNGKGTEGKGHEQEKGKEPLVIVHSDGIVDKWAIVVKNENTLSADAAMLGTERAGHMACMTKRLSSWGRGKTGSVSIIMFLEKGKGHTIIVVFVILYY